MEVDPAVVNLSAFETFFPEKRPFFLEGADIIRNFGRNGVNNTMGVQPREPAAVLLAADWAAPAGRGVEGDYVDTPSDATTIVGAAKLTGKTSDGWSFNMLEAVTAREYADVANGPAAPRRRGRAAHQLLRRAGPA